MYRRSLKLMLLCGVALGTMGLGRPASADHLPPDPALIGDYCAILRDSTGTEVWITNVGTAPILLCHGRESTPGAQDSGICDEAFSVCVGGKFEVGAVGIQGVNLKPVAAGGKFHFCEPFVQSGSTVTFLTQTATETSTNTPIYDLDAAPNNLPPGALVNVVMENQPANGKCIGVRTTIQHLVGTCKLWKIRKLFNTCSGNKTLTQAKEFELPCQCGKFTAQPGPFASRTAVVSTSLGEYITLAAGGNLGAKSKAGSVAALLFDDEFDSCLTPKLVTTLENSCLLPTTDPNRFRYLEVALSWTPGGVVLKPKGKTGSEKFVDFHLDIE